MNAPVRISEIEAGTLDDFRLCCADHAWFRDLGILALPVAADNLQWLAERWGLVELYGQDAIQADMAAAFKPAPDLPPGYVADVARQWDLADPRDSWRHTGEAAPLESFRKVRAAEAIKANPQKSDRAIAKELGIGNKTVSRARNSLVSDDTPEERVGRDGKSYPARRDAAPTAPRRGKDAIRERVVEAVAILSGLPPAAEVAAEIGVAKNTVRNARRELVTDDQLDRAIAAEIGVDHKTVGAARKSVGEYSPTATERTGRDGKSYPAKRDATAPDRPPAYRTAPTTVDAFFYVVGLNDESYLARWLAEHAADARYLERLLEARCHRQKS